MHDFSKGFKIWMGMDRKLRKLHPTQSPREKDSHAIICLADIIAELTSTEKSKREGAKSIVRELVKLGSE